MKLRTKLTKVTVVSLILISIVVVNGTVFHILSQTRALSYEDMERYAAAFVRAYENDIDFYFPRYRTYFPFYSPLSYTAKAIISKSYGSALLMNTSAGWLYECDVIDKRIEKAIFGGNWSTWPMFEIPPAGHHITISGGIYETSGYVDVRG